MFRTTTRGAAVAAGVAVLTLIGPTAFASPADSGVISVADTTHIAFNGSSRWDVSAFTTARVYNNGWQTAPWREILPQVRAGKSKGSITTKTTCKWYKFYSCDTSVTGIIVTSR